MTMTSSRTTIAQELEILVGTSIIKFLLLEKPKFEPIAIYLCVNRSASDMTYGLYSIVSIITPKASPRIICRTSVLVALMT
jgi:hypothetical protein